jgi:hypothetical protein
MSAAGPQSQERLRQLSAPQQPQRYIRRRRRGTRYEVLTNVLAPRRVSAGEALDLYPYRGSVERLFFDLKEVLNLNRLSAANPNAVAMQVYATAIVYNALRVAQSDGAAQVGWVRAAPEPVQVEHRADHRRTRRFSPARRHWKSLAHVRGGRRFTKLSWWR